MAVFKAQVNVKAKMEQTLLEDKMQITESNLSAAISTLTLSVSICHLSFKFTGHVLSVLESTSPMRWESPPQR